MIGNVSLINLPTDLSTELRRDIRKILISASYYLTVIGNNNPLKILTVPILDKGWKQLPLSFMARWVTGAINLFLRRKWLIQFYSLKYFCPSDKQMEWSFVRWQKGPVPGVRTPATANPVSLFAIYKFWQNCALVRLVSDLILKTVDMKFDHQPRSNKRWTGLKTFPGSVTHFWWLGWKLFSFQGLITFNTWFWILIFRPFYFEALCSHK